MSMNSLKYALKNKTFIIGAIMVITVVFIAVFADVIAPYSYEELNVANILKAPSAKHIFGTDHIGRDIFSRVVYGSRIALKVAIIAVTIQSVIGIGLGLLAGYKGESINKIINFITYLTLSLPGIVLAMAIIAVIGPSLNSVIIALSLVNWAALSRVVSIKTMAVKDMPYIEAARAFGESDLSIVLRYILPNISSVIIVLVSMSLPAAISITTGLSFLGMGSQPPSPDWGAMISEGINYIVAAPWVPIVPGFALAYTVLGFNLLGEGLRDLLDPTLKV